MLNSRIYTIEVTEVTTKTYKVGAHSRQEAAETFLPYAAGFTDQPEITPQLHATPAPRQDFHGVETALAESRTFDSAALTGSVDYFAHKFRFCGEVSSHKPAADNSMGEGHAAVRLCGREVTKHLHLSSRCATAQKQDFLFHK